MNEIQPLTDYEKDILVDKVTEYIIRRKQELIENNTEPHILKEVVKILYDTHHLQSKFKELPELEGPFETPEIMEVYITLKGACIYKLVNWMQSNGVIFTNKSQSDLLVDSTCYINGNKYKIYVMNDCKK